MKEQRETYGEVRRGEKCWTLQAWGDEAAPLPLTAAAGLDAVFAHLARCGFEVTYESDCGPDGRACAWYVALVAPLTNRDPRLPTSAEVR